MIDIARGSGSRKPHTATLNQLPRRIPSRRPTRTFRERGARLWFGRRGLEAHHAASSPIRFCQKRLQLFETKLRS